MEKTLRRSWRPRVVLAICAALLVVVAILLRIVLVETSVTTETTQGPAPTVSPAAASPPPSLQTTVKVTRVQSTASDTLELGILGFAGLLFVLCLLFDRLREVGGAGFSLKLGAADKQNAARAVARGTRERASAFIERAQGQPAMLTFDAARPPRAGWRQMVSMGSVQRAYEPAVVVGGQGTSAQQTAEATVQAISDAETLLRLGASSPDALRSLAEAWGIPGDDWAQVLAGEIPTELWDRLADRALGRVGADE